MNIMVLKYKNHQPGLILTTKRQIFAMLNVLYKSAIRSRHHKYTDTITMFTYYQAENSTAEPALVNAIEQGLRAQHGVVTEDDILMELTKWVEASDNDILSDIYQQTINYVVSGQHPTL